MADVIAQTAAEITAAVAGPNTPDSVRVDRSSRLSEMSLLGALGALIVFSAALFSVLAFRRWPDSQAHDQIHFLGLGLLLAIGGILLVVAALASPYIGRVQASAGPARIDLEGRA